MSSWTKREISELKSGVAVYWLKHRPENCSIEWFAEVRKKVMETLSNERLRREVVLEYVRGRERSAAARYAEACRSIGNAIARPEVWGESKEEIVDRFTKLAREEDAEWKFFEALRTRVLSEGLPHEVNAHDPTAEKR